MHNSQLFCTLLLSCRAEGRRPAVETSRPIGAFTFTNHTRSAQPAMDETFECSPSPGVAADCRRKAPNRPAVMSSGGPQARSRDIPTFRNFYPCDSHGFTLVPPSGPLDKLGVTKKRTYFVINREKCTTFGTSDPPERRGSRCRRSKREKFTSLTVTGGCPRTGSCNHAPKGGSTLTALYPDGRGPLVL